jgi:flagellar assembly protein FliH
MAVIRNKQISKNEPLLFNYRDAEEEAKRTVEAARVAAESVAAAARLDGFEDGRREGYEQGRAEGYAAGHAQALEEHKAHLESAAQALLSAAAQMCDACGKFHAEALSDCVELALSVARRVTKRHATIDPQVLAGNLDAALKMVIGCTRQRIVFHPQDRQIITDVLERLRFSNPTIDSAQLVEDPSVARGGCRIHTEHGLVDADLEAQLDRLVEQLMPASGEKTSEAS